jgi:hypothetical protein
MSSEFTYDDYDATYGGIIFWHNNESSHISTIHGKDTYTIYVLIQNTQEWEEEHFRDQGQGRVHDYLYEQVMGVSMNDTGAQNAACSSGFSIFYDQDYGWCVKFSSLWLNSNTRWDGIKSCGSNNSKMTNQGEAIIIIGAVMQWITIKPGSYVKIDYIPDQWTYNDPLVDDLHWILDSCGTDTNDINTWYTPQYWNCIPRSARL